LSALNVVQAAATGGGGGPSLTPKKWPWDDAARVGIAFLLVGLLVAVVLITTISAVSGSSSQNATIENYLKIVLSPIIGIVGSVVGFYFGAKSQSPG
jgi:hypothetical protein